jgi:hypothetical protein
VFEANLWFSGPAGSFMLPFFQLLLIVLKEFPKAFFGSASSDASVYLPNNGSENLLADAAKPMVQPFDFELL